MVNYKVVSYFNHVEMCKKLDWVPLGVIPIGDTVYISPWLYDSKDQGDWSIVNNIANVRIGYLVHSPSNDGDAISYKEYMEAGTYTLKITVVISPIQAIIKIKIDGVTVATFDNYNADIVRNVVKTKAGISVSVSGIKTIQVKIDGKNPLSTNYHLGLHEMIFYREA